MATDSRDGPDPQQADLALHELLSQIRRTSSFRFADLRQAWRSVDPSLGPVKAVEILTENGRVELCWNFAQQPPEPNLALRITNQKHSRRASDARRLRGTGDGGSALDLRQGRCCGLGWCTQPRLARGGLAGRMASSQRFPCAMN
jgi:hypothetical protein